MKKVFSLIIAAALALSTFCGCFLFKEQPEKVKITIDSDLAPELNIGDTYKLIYTCEQEVTVTCNGKFNYVTNVFTAEKAGNFEIKLAAGSEQTYNEVKVTVTVIAAGDKSELERLIAFAETLNPDDYYGFDAVTNELAFSNSVLSDKSVTQTRIDGAVASLDAVIKSLRPKVFGTKKAAVEENSISYGGEHYFKTYYTNFDAIASEIRRLNADDGIKLFSEYNAKITALLKKLVKKDGKELAEMNFQRGTLMAEKVFDDYYVSRNILAGGNIIYDVLDENGNHIKNNATGNKETDFWSLTAIFALMVRLDSVTEKSYKDKVDAVIDAMAYHRGTRNDNNVGENGAPREFRVYGVHRSRIKDHMDVVGYLGRESVFDDQVWAAQEFLNAYNLYGEKSYLDSAVELTEYIYLVGRCELGGIYWGQGYISRHACSSAPFVKLAVMLAKATGEGKYLDWAKDVYDWTYSTLRDPSDNLYYDLIGTRFKIDSPVPDSSPDWQNPKYIEGNEIIGNGNIDKKKYSYNSGSMVSAGVALYEATGEAHYLEEAKKTAYSARKYFGNEKVKEGFVVYPGSDGGTTYGWFDLILFKGYYDLYNHDKSAAELLNEVQNYFDYNYINYAKDGYIPTSGLSGWTDGRNSYGYRVLMDHSTNADVMLLLGQFKQD